MICLLKLWNVGLLSDAQVEKVLRCCDVEV